MNETMAREIAAQALILPLCVGPLADRMASIASPQGRIFAGGCGDSAFAPAALAGVFDVLRIEVAARTAMHLAAFQNYAPTDTVILTSISGGTRRTLEAADAARRGGARVIALTCKGESPLALAADDTIVLPFAPISRKTPHTLDYGVTLLALTQLALGWSGRGEAALPLDGLTATLDAARQVAASVATQLNPKGKLFILGAGPEMATAEYAAAKFHEAGGLPAFAFETENFVHGANFMVEPEDAIVTFGGSPAGLRHLRDVRCYQRLPLPWRYVPGDSLVRRHQSRSSPSPLFHQRCGQTCLATAFHQVNRVG